MQDLLTVTAELIVIVPILFLALDFSCGLMHLYSANPTTFQDKPEEEIAIVPTPTDPKETLPLDDPARAEVEEGIESFSCHALAPKRNCLLVPALSVEQPEIDYGGWTIRALKKEAQNRKLSKYSSLTKAQLISRLTAV